VTPGPLPTCTNPMQSSPPAGRAWHVFVSNPQQEEHAASKLLKQGDEAFLQPLTQQTQAAGGWRTNKPSCSRAMVLCDRFMLNRPSAQRAACRV